MERRSFLSTLPGLGLATFGGELGAKNSKQLISCNTYNWYSFYSRSGKNWGEDWAACIADFAKSGIPALEPSLDNAQMAKTIIPHLVKNGIAMPSVYVNSVLHEADKAEKSIQNILDTAVQIKKTGTKIVVTNPTPLKWGVNTELKTDEQLIIQAKSLNILGQKLKEMGLTLAYHTHDMEMMGGAREFHHMMQNTDPKNMSFCFDLHWVYRGSANSSLAVFDVLKMYGHRIAELHVRQSQNGIWAETFSAQGDIDYNKVVAELKKRKINPQIVIEQCVESISPNTMVAVEAHKINLREIKSTFKI